MGWGLGKIQWMLWGVVHVLSYCDMMSPEVPSSHGRKLCLGEHRGRKLGHTEHSLASSWNLSEFSFICLIAPSLIGPLLAQPGFTWPCLAKWAKWTTGHTSLTCCGAGWYLPSPASRSKVEGLRGSKRSQSWGLRPCLP